MPAKVGRSRRFIKVVLVAASLLAALTTSATPAQAAPVPLSQNYPCIVPTDLAANHGPSFLFDLLWTAGRRINAAPISNLNPTTSYLVWPSRQRAWVCVYPDISCVDGTSGHHKYLMTPRISGSWLCAKGPVLQFQGTKTKYSRANELRHNLASTLRKVLLRTGCWHGVIRVGEKLKRVDRHSYKHCGKALPASSGYLSANGGLFNWAKDRCSRNTRRAYRELKLWKSIDALGLVSWNVHVQYCLRGMKDRHWVHPGVQFAPLPPPNTAPRVPAPGTTPETAVPVPPSVAPPTPPVDPDPDKDGFVGAADFCPNTAGGWIMLDGTRTGCPDSPDHDGDGFPGEAPPAEGFDLCPNTPGVLPRGCPTD